MTLHLVALPHTRVSPAFNGCAYTAKALKFCRMMGGRDHKIVLYAPEGSDDAYCELVPVLSDEERQTIFGADDPNRLPAWPSTVETALFNLRASEGLAERYEPGDLVLLTAGLTHKPIMDALPHALFCEPGVGYEGIATPFCAFESHTHRHVVYAKQGIQDGRWFDTVIPNYFDLQDFPAPDGPLGDYLLFVGRIVPRKGPQIALEIAHAAGLPLLVAGAGATTVSEGLIIANEGTPDEVRLEGDVQHVGPVTIQERGVLMGGARALLAPTTYLEPFGGVAVEAMLCGTPAITSNWGAFTETVIPGLTGYRFSTLNDAVQAVHACERDLDRQLIRARTAAHYSLEAVAPRFEAWFDQLDTLHRDGWYELPTRPRLEAVA